MQEGSRVDPDRDSKPGCSRRRNPPRSRPLLRQRERARMDRREGGHRCRSGRTRPAAPQSPPDTAGTLAVLATSNDRPGSAALTPRTDIARPCFGAGEGCAASTFWAQFNPLCGAPRSDIHDEPVRLGDPSRTSATRQVRACPSLRARSACGRRARIERSLRQPVAPVTRAWLDRGRRHEVGRQRLTRRQPNRHPDRRADPGRGCRNRRCRGRGRGRGHEG